MAATAAAAAADAAEFRKPGAAHASAAAAAGGARAAADAADGGAKQADDGADDYADDDATGEPEPLGLRASRGASLPASRGPGASNSTTSSRSLSDRATELGANNERNADGLDEGYGYSSGYERHTRTRGVEYKNLPNAAAAQLHQLGTLKEDNTENTT